MWIAVLLDAVENAMVLHQLLHGHLLTAARYNPLLMLCLPLFGYHFVLYNVRVWRRRPVFPRRIPAKWIYGFLVALVLFAVLRNIPAYPFSLLAP